MNLESYISEVLLPGYGAWAVFLLLLLSGFGIPLGEEMVIIPAGVFVAAGSLRLWEVLIASYIGVVLADCCWFGLCRYYGSPLLHKRWLRRFIHPRRLLEVKHKLDRHGAWVIVFARFIPSSRSAAITVAGLFQIPFWKFFVATASCVAVTVPLQVGVGYLIGMGIGDVSFTRLIPRVIGLVILIALGSATISWVIGKRGSRTRRPRSPLRWLRRFPPRRAKRVAGSESRP